MNSKFISTAKKIHPIVWHIFSLAASIALFSFILANRTPNFLRPLSMSLRTGFGLVIPAATLVVYLAFRIPNRMGQLISMATTLSLFAMPLAGLWASGQSQSTVLSGLIQLTDAQLYYIEALGFLNGSSFPIFSARRPLFPGLLTVLLSITNHNLMVSLAILTAITGLACYFTAREIQHTHGAEAAVFILMVLFLFYRAHSGISMSEHLGVTLGALGFGLLWRGASTKSVLYVWSGLLITTLALNARAGAFFMLPILILWAGWLLRENKIISWKFVFIGASAVALGFALNLLFARLVAVPSGVPFANFSYTLYGLASGGKSWSYVFQAHPEVLKIQEPEQSRKIYQLAFELIRTNPLQTIQGALFNWKMLFSDSWYNVYAYVGGESKIVNMIARWGMYILCSIGIFGWIQKRHDPIQSLVMVSTLGIFISVPFLPPTDAYRMRPYAASIVILGALPAMGLVYLLRQIKTTLFSENRQELNTSSVSLIYSFFLISIIFIGPFFIKATVKPKSFRLVACATGSEPVIIHFDEGSFINLERSKLIFTDWMPNYHIGLFQQSAHSLADDNLIAWAQTIEPPATLFNTLNMIDNQPVLVVWKTKSLSTPAFGEYVQLCGKFKTDPTLRRYGIFYVGEMLRLSQ